MVGESSWRGTRYDSCRCYCCHPYLAKDGAAMPVFGHLRPVEFSHSRHRRHTDDRPLYTYCRHSSLAPANGRSVPQPVVRRSRRTHRQWWMGKVGLPWLRTNATHNVTSQGDTEHELEVDHQNGEHVKWGVIRIGQRHADRLQCRSCAPLKPARLQVASGL